jgi:hypothetical protein
VTTPPREPSRAVPAGDEIARWTNLAMNADTERERAILDAAWKIADDANSELAAARNDPAGSPTVRGKAWCRLALSAYQRLHHASAYTHLDPMAPACVADPQRIRDWLASPSGMAGLENDTLAQVWDFDAFSATDVHSRLTNLIEQAQAARVFVVPGHRIGIWHLAGDDLRLDGHLITVETPDGAHHTSDHLPTETVVAADLSGADAVVDTLTGLAATIDTVLARSRAIRPVADGPTSGPDPAPSARPFLPVVSVGPLPPLPPEALAWAADPPTSPHRRRNH